RRPLCVESTDLPFPESTASAEIVKAGQQGGTDAPRYIFGALGLGAFLQVLKDEKGFQVFKDSVSFFVSFPKSAISYFGYQKEQIGTVTYAGGIAYTTPSASPALMGIGYIIGPRLAAINFSGGVIAWLLLIPLVLFIDPDLPARLGATTTGGRAPWDLVSYTVWYNVVRPIAVGAYLVGLVGSSNQPVSGLTLCALVIAALVMVAIGMKGLGGVAAVLGVASVVCCACCVSGSLIQDLKAGYLLGGTPWKMEVVEVLSVTAVSFFLLLPIIALNEANLATGGIGGRELPAPQAGLMAELAQGIVGGQMPWGLLLMGCLFGLGLVMIEAPSPMLIAVGMYLPLETTSSIFVGGVIKWLADRWVARRKLSPGEADKFAERGTLVASGF